MRGSSETQLRCLRIGAQSCTDLRGNAWGRRLDAELLLFEHSPRLADGRDQHIDGLSVVRLDLDDDRRMPGTSGIVLGLDMHAVSGVTDEGYAVKLFDMMGTTVAVVTLPASSLRVPTPADRHALAAKDETTLQNIVAQEFTIVGTGSTPDDMVTDRASWMRAALLRPFPKHEVTNLRATRVGDVAIVQCVLIGVYPPRSLTQEGGTRTFLTTDVWAKRNGAWQVMSRHSSLPRPPVIR